MTTQCDGLRRAAEACKNMHSDQRAVFGAASQGAVVAHCLERAILALPPCECQQRIEALERKLAIAELKNKGTLANNLCPDHRDKQTGKPCLACTIETAERRYAELEAQAIEHNSWMLNLAHDLGAKDGDDMAEFIPRRVAELLEHAEAMTKATYSHVDGRDLLAELQLNGAHFTNIMVRINGQWKEYEGDWLKRLWRERQAYEQWKERQHD